MINNEHDVQNEPTVTFEDTNKSYKQKSGGGLPTGAKVALIIIALALVITIVCAAALLALVGIFCVAIAILGIVFVGGMVLGAYLYTEYEKGNIDLPAWLDRSIA